MCDWLCVIFVCNYRFWVFHCIPIEWYLSAIWWQQVVSEREVMIAGNHHCNRWNHAENTTVSVGSRREDHDNFQITNASSKFSKDRKDDCFRVSGPSEQIGGGDGLGLVMLLQSCQSWLQGWPEIWGAGKEFAARRCFIRDAKKI